MNPPKYHIYIEYTNPQTKPAMRFNQTQEEVTRLFAKPYTAGKPFMFCGRLVNPKKVQQAVIFCSQQDATNLVLPNREEVANHPDKKFVMDYILRGKLKGVSVCTEKFLPPNAKGEQLGRRVNV